MEWPPVLPSPRLPQRRGDGGAALRVVAGSRPDHPSVLPTRTPVDPRSPDGPVVVRLRVAALGAAEPAGRPLQTCARTHLAVGAPGRTCERPGAPSPRGTVQIGARPRREWGVR